MKTAPDGPYVYQPYGSISHPSHNEAGRLWAIGGLSSFTQIKGLTREEADAILPIMKRAAEGDERE